jgi:hypothetical protein
MNVVANQLVLLVFGLTLPMLLSFAWLKKTKFYVKALGC